MDPSVGWGSTATSQLTVCMDPALQHILLSQVSPASASCCCRQSFQLGKPHLNVPREQPAKQQVLLLASHSYNPSSKYYLGDTHQAVGVAAWDSRYSMSQVATHLARFFFHRQPPQKWFVDMNPTEFDVHHAGAPMKNIYKI